MASAGNKAKFPPISGVYTECGRYCCIISTPGGPLGGPPGGLPGGPPGGLLGGPPVGQPGWSTEGLKLLMSFLVCIYRWLTSCSTRLVHQLFKGPNVFLSVHCRYPRTQQLALDEGGDDMRVRLNLDYTIFALPVYNLQANFLDNLHLHVLYY